MRVLTHGISNFPFHPSSHPREVEPPIGPVVEPPIGPVVEPPIGPVVEPPIGPVVEPPIGPVYCEFLNTQPLHSERTNRCNKHVPY